MDDIDVVMRSRGSYADLTRESRSSPNLPPGKLLRARPTGGWSSRRGEVYFDDDFWAQTDVAPVPVPGRVSRFHPAVQAYRDDPDRHEVSRDSLGRACRILQAIAVEAESRGYSCTAPSRNSYNSGFRDTLKKGQLHVTIGDFTHRLRIRERSAPGGSPTYTVRRASTMPLWKIVRKKVFIPTGELLITIDDGDGLDGRPAEYRDGKRQALEDRLPSVLRELETRAREDDRRRREKAEEAARRRANWERAMHQARHDHREAYRRDVLRAQVVRWREDAELGLYVQELAAAVASITEDDERREAQAWLDWIRSYRENRNPLRRPAMPPDPQPSPAQLKPFLKGWSPYGPHTSY